MSRKQRLRRGQLTNKDKREKYRTRQMKIHPPGPFHVFKTNMQEVFSYFIKGAILYHAIKEENTET